MNVQQLINKLEKVKNKQKRVYILNIETYDYLKIKKVVEDKDLKSLNIEFN